jgi:Flp pilus assembly protein TadD
MRISFAILSAVLAIFLTACAQVSPEATAPVKEEPNQGLVRLAQDIEGRGESATALALYERAAVVSGDAADYVRLGDAYSRANRVSEAIAAYRAALGRAPDDAEATLGLGAALVKKGDYEGGLAALAKVAPVVKTAAAYNRLGVAQTLTGRLHEAESSFERARELAPDDLDISTNLALAAALAGEDEKAITLMQGVVQSAGAEPRHQRNLVIIYSLFGRIDEARAAAPEGLSAQEIQKLIDRAKSIRAINDARARARALGTITS